MAQSLKLKILGCKGYSPWKSRYAKKWTSCRLFWNSHSLQIDIGNKYEGKPVDYLLISHLHYDHVQEFATCPSDTLVLVPSGTFIETLKKKNLLVNFRLFKREIDLHGLKVKAFPVLHSKSTLTYGFKFSWRGKNFVWLPDYCIIPMFSEVLNNLDVLFLGSAAMKKDIEHKGYGHCQRAVWPILEKIQNLRKPPKKIFLIHFGMGMRPIPVKVKYLQKSFPDLNINFTYDNQKILLS